MAQRGRIESIVDIGKIEGELKTLNSNLETVLKKVEGIAVASANIKFDGFDKAKNIKETAEASVTLNNSTTKSITLSRELMDANSKRIAKQKELDKAEATLEKQRQKGLATMAKQEAKERELTAAINKEIKSEQDLIAQTNALIQKRKMLDKTTESGKKKHAELTAKIKENNAALKDSDKTIGVHNRNVGNYTQGITSAAGQLGMMPPAVGKVTAALNLLSFGFKSLRTAIMSTGIGALVIGLVSLVSYFKSTEEGAAKFQKVLAPFQILFGNLKDALSDLGEYLVATFENPQQAIKDLWEGIKNNFIVRIQATMKFVSAFGDVLQGVWELDTDKIKAGATEAGKQWLDVLTGVENSASKSNDIVGNFIKKISDETQKETALRQKAIDDELALSKKKRAFLVEEAELQTKVSELRLIANDRSKTAEERQKAINEAIQITNVLSGKRTSIAEEELRLLKLNASFSDSNADTLDEIATKQREIILIKKTEADESRRMVSMQGTINNELDAQINKQKELLKLIADGDAEMMQGLDQEFYDGLEAELKAGEEKLKTETQILDEQLKEQSRLRDEQRDDQAKKDQEAADNRRALEQGVVDGISEGISLVNELYQNQIAQQIEDLEAQKEYELELVGNNEEAKDSINRKYAAKEAALKTKAAKADKTAATIKALINTALAITSALTIAPPAGFILAAIAGVLGGIQVAAIQSQPIPKYFKGRDGGPAELAITGDQGAEIIDIPGKGQYLTPDTSTLTFLPQGASVIPNAETMERLANPEVHKLKLMSDLEMKMLRNDVNGLHKGFSMLADVVKNKKEFNINITEEGMYMALKNGENWTNYVNKNIMI